MTGPHSYERHESDRELNNNESAATNLFLIGSTTRAGSTLLSSLLTAATGAFDCGELHLLWSSIMTGRTCTCGEPVASCTIWSAVVERTLKACNLASVEEAAALSRTELRQRDLLRATWPDLNPRLVEFQRQVYAAIRATTGVDVLVDSSKLASNLRTSLATTPRALLIHLTRDPRAVTYSWSNPHRDPSLGGALMPARSTLSSVATWLGTNESLARLARRTPSSVHVRYEDLATIRETKLAGLVPGLGENEAVFAPSHAIAGNPTRFNQRQSVVIDTRWQTQMPRGRRAVVSLLTFPVRSRYGYISYKGWRS